MLYIPQRPKINRAHFVSRGLVADFLLNAGSKVSGVANSNIRDLVNNTLGTPTSGTGISQGVYGKNITFPSVTTDQVTPTGQLQDKFQQSGGPFSIMMLVKINSSNTVKRTFMEIKGNGGTPTDIWFELNTGGTNRVGFGYYDGSSWFEAAWVSGFAAGSTHLIIGVWDKATQRIYADGDPNYKATNSITNPPAGTAFPEFSAIGNGISQTSSFEGNIYATRIWNRALTVKDRMALWADPFCIYRPQFMEYANTLSTSQIKTLLTTQATIKKAEGVTLAGIKKVSGVTN